MNLQWVYSFISNLAVAGLLGFFLGRAHRELDRFRLISYSKNEQPSQDQTPTRKENIIFLNFRKQAREEPVNTVDITVRINADWEERLEKARAALDLNSAAAVLRQAIYEIEWRIEQEKAGNQMAICLKEPPKQ